MLKTTGSVCPGKQQRGAGLFGHALSLLRPSALRLASGGSVGTVLHFGDLTLDLATRDVRRADRTIELTPTEFSLLTLFLRNPQRALTRSAIFTHVWGFDFSGTSNALAVCVGNLRRKTEAAGEPRYVHTLRGVGYVLREPRAPR
jgi:two-component system response regulator MprA